MNDLSQWPWPRTLALSQPGQTVQVKEILFDLVRDRCWELGIREGSVVECRDRDGSSVVVDLPNGERAQIPRDYAWFVSVDLL